MKRKISMGIWAAAMLAGLTGCGDTTPQPEESVSSLASQSREGGHLQMTFLNTGKSDCIIIDLGESVIINDTADADDYGAIRSFLDERQITDIDYLILSHFDKDHIGSAAELITHYEVDCVLMPDYEENSVYYAALMEALEESGTESVRLQEDYSFTAAGAEFYISAPEQEEYGNDNNYSLITAAVYGENSFLLMGDAMKKRTEEFLETAQGAEQYDLIKMPHHGDYNKKLEELIESAEPVWAVLTAGQERARLEEETLQMLEEYGCKVYDTADGDILVEADGINMTVTQGGR